MSRKITIRDVAEKAGVSISSVHLALNGKRGVSEETRKEIKRVAEELGYHPNVIASTLKRKSGCIAILVPDVMDNNRYYYPPIWKGIRGYIDQDIAGLEFLEFPYNDSTARETEGKLSKLLHAHEINGLLTVGHENVLTEEDWRLIEEQDIKVVFISSVEPNRKRLTSVEPSYEIIGRTMAELITSRIEPYGSIFLCAGNPKYLAHSRVVRGFDAYLEENNIPNLVYKDYSWTIDESNYLHILREISRQDVAACAAVHSQGTILIGRALEESGKAGNMIAVGSDISEETTRRIEAGTLTYVIQKNPYAQSYLGLQALADYFMAGKTPKKQTIYVGSEVVLKSNLIMYEDGSYNGIMLN